MGLSTHVLDTTHGCPASGMAVQLYTTTDSTFTLIKTFALNADGRNPDRLLLTTDELKVGTYRLVFGAVISCGSFICRPTLQRNPSLMLA